LVAKKIISNVNATILINFIKNILFFVIMYLLSRYLFFKSLIKNKCDNNLKNFKNQKLVYIILIIFLSILINCSYLFMLNNILNLPHITNNQNYMEKSLSNIDNKDTSEYLKSFYDKHNYLNDFYSTENIKNNTFIFIILNIIMIIFFFIAAYVEEYQWRFLYFKTTSNKYIYLNAIAFSIWHLLSNTAYIITLPCLFVFAFFLAKIYIKTSSLTIVSVIHFFYNFVLIFITRNLDLFKFYNNITNSVSRYFLLLLNILSITICIFFSIFIINKKFNVIEEKKEV